MPKFSRKKAAIAGATAVFVLAMTAAVAFAAPVLQPGVTSAPGMSGTCTNCHTYASTPAAPAKPKIKKTAVSRPYVSKRHHHASKSFAVWGFISPRIPHASTATLTVGVQQFTGGSWVTTSSLAATGTVSQKGSFKHKTNYWTTMTFAETGLYRLRTKLIWTDAKGVEHTKWSKPRSVRIYK